MESKSLLSLRLHFLLSARTASHSSGVIDGKDSSRLAGCSLVPFSLCFCIPVYLIEMLFHRYWLLRFSSEVCSIMDGVLMPYLLGGIQFLEDTDDRAGSAGLDFHSTTLGVEEIPEGSL